MMPPTDPRYARAIENSRRVEWDIDRDVVRGRDFDYTLPFLPDGLSLADELPFLSRADRRTLSQVQGRTYARMYGLFDRFIGARVLSASRAHWDGDPAALEALVRTADEELKHQELFRRMETAMAATMPAGYAIELAEASDFLRAVSGASPWAALVLMLDIELFTQAHYRASIAPAVEICPLWKDVFLMHWKEEAQHATIDELELQREDARLAAAARDAALDEFLGLVDALDRLLQARAKADAAWFETLATRHYGAEQQEAVEALVLKAYRWQYLVSGAMEPRFQRVFFRLLDGLQASRVRNALVPFAYALPLSPAVALPMAA